MSGISIGQRVRGARDDVTDLRSRLTTLVESVDWTGPDADAFRSAWTQHAATLQRLGALLDGAARRQGSTPIA